MAEVSAVTVTKKKSKTTVAVKKAEASHPPTSIMVNQALKELKKRNGSSLQAIKKYIAAQFMVDTEKLAPFIKKYLKSSVASGEIIQTKGKGASGSFKLESSSAAKKPAVKPKIVEAASSTKKVKSAPKAKKATVKKVVASPAKASPIAKKTVKPPTKKPKAPKAKKAAAKKATPKKTTAKK